MLVVPELPIGRGLRSGVVARLADLFALVGR
jgi:hypothetical protein